MIPSDNSAPAGVSPATKDAKLAQFHVMRGQALRTDRGVFDQHCEQVARIVMPSHRNTFIGHGWTMPYQQKTEYQYDAHATVAALRFSAVMESLLTPQNSLWHRLVPADKMLKQNRMVRAYLDTVNDLLYSYRNRPWANFVGQIQMLYLSLGLYGNGCLFMDKPMEAKGIRYKFIHLGEAYYVQNHQGIVDTLYRFYMLTSLQALEKFGEDCPPALKKQAMEPGQTETLHEFLHVVTPRDIYDPRRIDGAGMRYASFHFYVTEQLLLRESGYNKKPIAISRYMTAPNEVYGRGPAMLVLPTIKLLNEEKKSVIKQGHRALDPVILAADDGVVGTFSLRNGAVNYGAVSADGKPLVHALPTGNLAVGDKMMEMERTTIDDAFLMSVFKMLDENPQMTATQVLEIAREKGMLVAPTAGRQFTELLGPMIERELDLLTSQGCLPPMPLILKQADGEIKVEYDSPMARMQRAENAAGFMHSLDMAANYAKLTNDPAPLDWFDFDVATPAILDINGSPSLWTRSPEAVAALRKSRDDKAQQQSMLQNASGLGSAVSSVGKILGPAKPNA